LCPFGEEYFCLCPPTIPGSNIWHKGRGSRGRIFPSYSNGGIQSAFDRRHSRNQSSPQFDVSRNRRTNVRRKSN
jgi:hypothetical protein